MWIYNETIIKTPKSMTIGSVLYPSTIFKDKDLLASLGILPYREESINQRYYWQGQLTIVDGVGTYTTTPKDVDGLKEDMISKVRTQVGARIQPTDWMVIREADGGSAMPADVKAYRAAVRAEGNTKETEINALSTLEDIILYEATPYTEVRKVKHTAEDGTETYGPETETSTRHINLTLHFNAVDPQVEVDPAFVSLTKDV